MAERVDVSVTEEDGCRAEWCRCGEPWSSVIRGGSGDHFCPRTWPPAAAEDIHSDGQMLALKHKKKKQRTLPRGAGMGAAAAAIFPESHSDGLSEASRSKSFSLQLSPLTRVVPTRRSSEVAARSS